MIQLNLKAFSSTRLLSLAFITSTLFAVVTPVLATPALATPALAPPLLEKQTQSPLEKIAADYFEEDLQLNPLEASETTGEERFEDKLTITITQQHRNKTQKFLHKVAKKLAGLDAATLSSAEKITYAMLKREVEMQLAGNQFPNHLLPMDQYGGLPVYLAQLGSGQDIQPLKTVKNYDHYLARLNKLPLWIDQAIKNMREGSTLGVVQPREIIERSLPSIKTLCETNIEASSYFLAIKNMPDSFSAAEKKRLTAAYKKTINTKLLPATIKLYSFLAIEYLPKTRKTAGISALPNGEEWYKHAVKFHTTTDLTPAEIHTLGLEEVKRIRMEMAKIQTQFKFNGSLTEFLSWQHNATEFTPFKTEQEILTAYADLNKKIIAKLPQLFGRSPSAQLAIRAEPELTRETASDHYNPPAIDGSRPGTYYTVIEDPTQYRNTKMTSLFLHEGQPGHHYHIALQQELSLPKFRKFGWITAYGEGWALYAETLGKELGLYDDPNQYLGHLKLELVRAVRLVADTGLHAKGWTREQTIAYMMETEGNTEAEARRATERYMVWPGQALAYKIGALKFQELRARAQQKLGEKFHLNEFHDLVLSEGVLPLNILDSKVNEWISTQQYIYFHLPINLL